jgi:DNA primase
MELATDSAGRTYKKLSQGQGKLKVHVKICCQGETVQETVDLYSARNRKQVAQAFARELGLESRELESWFFQILDELQNSEEKKVQELDELFVTPAVPPMSDVEREEALAYLRRPDLVEAILQDMETLGYMGDEIAKLLGYLISISRMLEKPMSGIIQSGSGAGKSFLAEMIERLTPPESVVLYSRLSALALVYMPKDFLKRKLLILEERVGGEAADYQIRSLQSKQRLKQAVVVKDPSTGRMQTRCNEVEGPVAYLETTTNLRLNPENTSRCFEIPLDESPEQTRRIHQRQRALKTVQGLAKQETGEKLAGLHHRAQRLLQPVSVVIPYVDHLSFPDRWLRTRRDHDRFLCLIEALAFLHQHQRVRHVHQGVEYIEATLDDYRWAYQLAQAVLQNSLDELSRWARILLAHFHAHSSAMFTRRELREALLWPDRRLRESLQELAEMEFVEVQRSDHGNLFLYRAYGASDGPSTVAGLLSPPQLQLALQP